MTNPHTRNAAPSQAASVDASSAPPKAEASTPDQTARDYEGVLIVYTDHDDWPSDAPGNWWLPIGLVAALAFWTALVFL